MDLIEFLLARLDEDEGAARVSRSTLLIAHLDRCAVPGSAERDTFLHHERWEPPRVLAEIEAKRFTIEYLRNNEDRSALTDPEEDMGKRANNEAGALRRLAWPYHDHPDYDPVWIPSGFPGSLHTSPVRRHG